MTALITITVLTLAVSGICSLFEAVLYSTRVAAVEAEKTKGDRGNRAADRMLGLKSNISVPIAAILILNTIANTAGANYAGVYCAKILSPQMVPVYTVGFVLGILFLSEIIPKTLGAAYWRGLWAPISLPLVGLKNAMYPLVFATQKVTGVLTGRQPATSVTEEEILAMVQLGFREGHISEEEKEMVDNIILLENKHAKDIMTPRIVMSTLPSDTTVADAVERIRTVGFSRILMYREHPENITGYVLRRDLLVQQPEDDGAPIESLAKPISFIPENANCLSLLNQYLRHRLHIAVVTDEYGGVAGLVTLEDLIETLLGSEIIDETDQAIDMREMAERLKLGRNRPAIPGAEPTDDARTGPPAGPDSES